MLPSHRRELDLEDILTVKVNNVLSSAKVGSRVTCNPPPKDTDQDILVLVRNSKLFADDAIAKDFMPGGSFIDAGVFKSLTRGEINLIVTEYPEFYRRFLCATRLARAWNILEKPKRIRLFQAILYGNG